VTTSARRGLVLGTAGHVDHGKTSLVRALTGVQTDRWREERERGLTIDIGFAPFELAEDLESAFVDVPGHEDFLKNMLAGATGIDLLLLVVAADEGPMPQTREHLAIAHLLDVRRGVVALTKRDRVDDEWLALATETTRELLESTPECGQWPIVAVSSTTGEGIDDLLATLREVAAGVESKRHSDLFRMPVDRAFTIHGTGTVVTGTVWSGAVGTGDMVRLLPEGGTSRVRGLEVHGQRRADVGAGRRCALALVGVDAGAAERGTVLDSEQAWRGVSRIGVRIETLAGPGRPLEHDQRVRLYLGTREVMARVMLLGGKTLAPGEPGWGTLMLEDSLVVRARDRGILRFYSPVTTIGGVRVCELDPPRAWESRVRGWEVILEGDPGEAFTAAVRLSGARGLSLEDAPIALGVAPHEIEQASAASHARSIGHRWYSAEAWADALAAVLGAVQELHATHRRSSAVSLESIRSSLAADFSGDLIEACLHDHIDGGRLTVNGPRVSLPGTGATLTASEDAYLAALRTALRGGGLQPPTVNDLQQALQIPRDLLDDLLRLLSDAGATRSITPEIYVDSDALADMTRRVREIMAGGEIAEPTVFKREFGLSRKYLIPLLEHLDSVGVTRRTPAGRVLAS